MSVIEEPSIYEENHVHQVYEKIASHFSATRYKAWPVVDNFLRSLPTGAIGLDIGCGNGKYLTVNKDVFIVASDRSESLISFAKEHQPHSAIVADTLHLPHPEHSFDFVICIAVIHHFSSSSRRIEAVQTILDTLRRAGPQNTAGEALIFVWALEQKGSRRGWDKGDSQDVLVPWVLKSQSSEVESKTYQRYYHLYAQGELEADTRRAGGLVVRAGYDRDNWWVVIKPM